MNAQPNTSVVRLPQQETAPAEAPGRSLNAFSNAPDFETAQRIAHSLAASTLVPTQYRGSVANCLIAMELANRVGASVFMVMQSLDVIKGNPSWRSQFLIASVNTSGRFTPLRFEFTGEKGTDSWGCTAVSTDKKSGELCEGETVTMAMAKADGWYHREGSKWKTMPGQMLRYRSAAFWVRVYCPEIALGMQTVDEMEDAVVVDEGPGAAELNQELAGERKARAEAVDKVLAEKEKPDPDDPGAEPQRPGVVLPNSGPLRELLLFMADGANVEGPGTAVPEQRDKIRRAAVHLFEDGTEERESLLTWADHTKLGRSDAGKLISLAKDVAQERAQA